jgi:hypothetical protein
MLLKRILIALSMTAILTACGGDTPTPTPTNPATYSEVSYKVLVSGMQWGNELVDWEAAAFANATNWTTFWKTTYGDSATPPAVDFSKNNVVGAYLVGSDGCTSIQINQVSQNHTNTQVKYSYKRPAGAICTQAIVDLTTFLTVPKQGDGLASVSFVRE